MNTELSSEQRPVVCFITNSAGDWGGASRVLFTNLRLMDRQRLSPLLLLPRHGPIEAELQQRNLRYRIWGPLTEPGKPMAYVSSFFRALRFFRSENVAVIHINGSNFWRPAELLAAWVLRIPIIAHYHVINDQPGPFMALCRAAISVSRFTAEQSLPSGLPKPVIYNSISLERFDAGRSLRGELGLNAEHVVVAFLGQIRDIKGVADFIAMARKIDHPNARFLIAGECRDPKRYPGSYSEQDLKDMAGGDARIRYIGYVREVENVYHTADIVVVPSRWQEPLGLINLEASACRKPIVATRVGGIPEVVEDGVNGYLVEPGEVTLLAQRVAALIADPALRQRMGEAGRARVEAEFTTRPVRAFEDLILDFARR
jgi:glycosyltransferase involved in cell wall biosynthesis